jgi:hypothetical protein
MTAKPVSFADALQSALQSALLFQRTAAEVLTENTDVIARVARLIDDTAPFHAQRLNRLVAELRVVAAELSHEGNQR